MRWGRIVSFHAHLDDPAAVDGAPVRVAATGVDDAVAPPIVTAGQGA